MATTLGIVVFVMGMILLAWIVFNKLKARKLVNDLPVSEESAQITTQ